MALSASEQYISIGTPRTTNNDTLANTPTWAVGVVCIIIVIASFFLELGLKHLNAYFQRTHQKPLQDTLARMKEDVMMLGFISLMLVITRDSLAKICVPDILSDYMLPCQDAKRVAVPTGIRGVTPCSQSRTPLMSTESLHQLHMFIFVMAIVHVCYSCMTMILARLQIRGWIQWEDEIRNLVLIDSPEVHRQAHFLVDRVHSTRWASALGLPWIDSFVRQFWNPVKKSDYLNLRRGFVKSHNASPKFNFLDYMMRTMEDDFKTIVAIRLLPRAYLWMFVIIFMLLNIHGWYTYFWVAFLPFMLLLIVGTKLQHVITSLALEIVNSDGEIGDSVKPRDELFWFNNPQFMLHLIHFILFQNSFELAYFTWIWSTYGLDCCFMEKRGLVYTRVALGFVSQILCSYTTLPLYALVTQMGSSYKKAIFSPPLAKSLIDWHDNAKKSRKKRTEEGNKDSAQGGHDVAAIASHIAVGLLPQQDSLDSSHVPEAPKAPASENKDSGLLAQKCSSDLSILKGESTLKDSPKTEAEGEHLRSAFNPVSGTETTAEVQRRMSTTIDQSNTETSHEFVSVTIDSPACREESSRLDHSKYDVKK